MNKRKIMSGAVSIALAVTMLSTTAFAAGISFSDVPSNHWAVPYITEMSEKGVMAGVGNNQFAPEKTLTYAEFFTMIATQFYEDKITTGGDQWYSGYVAAVEAAGVTEGLQMPSYTAQINRYEMAQVMYNVLRDQGLSTSVSDQSSKIGDWASVPDNYKSAVNTCYGKGMLSGVDAAGTFNGTGVMTRAQAAVVMSVLLKNVGSAQEQQEQQTPAGIPADATKVTSESHQSYKHDTGVQQSGDEFHVNGAGMTYGCASVTFDTSNSSQLAITIRALDTGVRVQASLRHVGQAYTAPNEIRELGVVAPNTSQTFVVDVSNTTTTGFYFNKADAADAGVFVECYFSDVYMW